MGLLHYLKYFKDVDVIKEDGTGLWAWSNGSRFSKVQSLLHAK